MPRASVVLRGANADRGRLKPVLTKQNMFYGESEQRRTDDLGRFRFPDLSPGSYEVKASRDGGAPVKRPVELPAGQDVLHVELRFAAGRNFVVTVIDSAGAPVKGALLGVRHAQSGLNGRTDAGGSAEFTVSGAVRSVSVWGMIDQTRSDLYAFPTTLRDLGDATEATITLERTGLVRGVVLDPDGNPFASPVLQVLLEGKPLRTVFGEADGSFKAKIPRGAAVDLRLTGRKKPMSAGFTSESVAYSGELRGVRDGSAGVELHCIAVPADGTLTVRVLTPDGEPLKGVQVSVQGHADGPRNVHTAGDGRAHFENLLQRELTVGVLWRTDLARSADFVQPKQETAVPNGQEIVMRCRSGFALHGIATLLDGKPAAGGSVVVIVGKQTYMSITGVDGRFRILIAEDEAGESVRVSGFLRSGKDLYQGNVEGVMPRDGEVEITFRKVIK